MKSFESENRMEGHAHYWFDAVKSLQNWGGIKCHFDKDFQVQCQFKEHFCKFFYSVVTFILMFKKSCLLALLWGVSIIYLYFAVIFSSANMFFPRKASVVNMHSQWLYKTDKLIALISVAAIKRCHLFIIYIISCYQVQALDLGCWLSFKQKKSFFYENVLILVPL